MFRVVCVLLFATLMALPASSALAAEGYPQKTIRLVIPFAPGGGTDALARAFQDRLEAALGGSVIIDNRGGVGGTLGVTLAARAAPDGTPQAIVMKLHDEIAKLFRLPEMLKKMTAMGAVLDLKTPDEMRKIIPVEIAKWTKVAIDARMPRAEK